MKVVYFGTYRSEYSRNRILINGLRKNGVDVTECHEVLWKDINDRISVAGGGWLKFSFLFRLISVYFRLFIRGLQLRDYDVLICGYPGQLDVFLARIISWLHKRPLVWDVFMSIYLISIERKLERKSSITVKLLKLLEFAALRLPDLLVQDTKDYVLWFEKQYRIPKSRFQLIPTGADDQVFYSQGEAKQKTGQSFSVLYYGTFIPNHGVPYIMKAVQILRDYPAISFVFIGEGPDLEYCKSIVEEHRLKNVFFKQWMDQSQLVREIVQSDICLGAFGDTPQSLMTVQNKIYEAMACARPVVTGDSPAVRNVLAHRESAWLCDRDNPKSLADAIVLLNSDSSLRQQIAKQGYDLYNRSFTAEKLGEKYALYLQKLIKND